MMRTWARLSHPSTELAKVFIVSWMSSSSSWSRTTTVILARISSSVTENVLVLCGVQGSADRPLVDRPAPARSYDGGCCGATDSARLCAILRDQSPATLSRLLVTCAPG